MPDQSPRRTKQPQGLRQAIIYANLALAVALTIGVAGVTTRIADGERRRDSLRESLGETSQRIEALAAHNIELQHEVAAAEARTRLSELKSREADAAKVTALRRTLDERIAAIETRHQSERSVQTTGMQEELQRLRSEIALAMVSKTAPRDRFQLFAEDHRLGLVLVYTEFDYERLDRAGRGKAQTVTGWGSGFFATTEGHIVTNKHVVHPWKFDADLLAMEALGEIRIRRDSLRITAWPQGTAALDHYGDPVSSGGLNTHVNKRLSIFASAKDHWRDESIDIGHIESRYRVHTLDDSDIMILKAHGGPFHALPILQTVDEPGVGTLDAVMALGFPRGKKGLESRVAVASATMGEVRKAESTIHISASIIPGNSGGPLVGPQGKVVGIVTRIYSETLGICIKIQHALDLIESAKPAKSAEKSLPPPQHSATQHSTTKAK